MKIGKCGCCGKPIAYKMVEIVEGYPKLPRGTCYNPECKSFDCETDYIETSPNDLDEDEDEVSVGKSSETLTIERERKEDTNEY